MFKNIDVKKVTLWLLIIMVGCFVIAGSILVIRGTQGTFYGMNAGGSQSVDTEKTFSVSGIKDIRINTVSEDVNIIPVDSGDIKAHFYGSVSGSRIVPDMIAQQNNDTLEIRIDHKTVIGINFGSFNLKLDVYVPKAYTNSLNVETTSGSIDIKDFNLDIFRSHSVSGDMTASGVMARTTDISTTSGKVELVNLNTDILKSHSVSGDLIASGVITKNANIGTTSGRIDVNGFGGDLNYESVSGDISVQYTDFMNNINMHTTSGRMRLTLPEKSQFTVSFSTTSGHFESAIPMTTNGSNSKRSFQGSVGNSSNKITASSVSGDLYINK